MKVIELGLPERFRLDLFGVARWLPETPRAIFSRLLAECLRKASRHVVLAVVAKLPSCELAKVCHDRFQSFGIERLVKENAVEMSGHNHIGVDSESFFVMAEV